MRKRACVDRALSLPNGNVVFSETLNRIGNNIGRQAAVLAGHALLERDATGDILLTHSTPSLAAAALELLNSVEAPPDKRPSFVDCLVMATANANNTREIFGFDAVFAKNGYFLPGASEQKVA